MEKINNNNELEIMRSQMASFKKQLEQQEIINSRIMSESMKKKFSWIKKMIIGEIILIPIFLYLAFAAKYYLDLSWWSTSTFIILLLCDVWCDYDINMRAIKNSDYSRDNLVNTMEKLLRMKQRRTKQAAIMLITLIGLIIWFSIEISLHLISINAATRMWGVFYGGVVGGVIGIAVSWWIYCKMQKTNDEMIKQIEEISKEQ
ncbi:hypothetical protein [Prevotella merdae]|uniref:hypothetical protein n=1 Tax=Prevotella merdae TaxID=2079531 RepID=UPI00356274F1